MARSYHLTPAGLARKRSPETRAKISAAMRGRKRSPETRAKMSAASKAALADPAVRAKMSAARFPHLASLTEQQRADYLALKKAGYTKDEALCVVTKKYAA